MVSFLYIRPEYSSLCIAAFVEALANKSFSITTRLPSSPILSKRCFALPLTSTQPRTSFSLTFFTVVLSTSFSACLLRLYISSTCLNAVFSISFAISTSGFAFEAISLITLSATGMLFNFVLTKRSISTTFCSSLINFRFANWEPNLISF